MLYAATLFSRAIVLVDSDCAMQTNGSYHNEAFSGEKRIPMSAMDPMPMNALKIIARRCAMELKAGAVVNLGIGMPEGVANIIEVELEALMKDCIRVSCNTEVSA